MKLSSTLLFLVFGVAVVSSPCRSSSTAIVPYFYQCQVTQMDVSSESTEDLEHLQDDGSCTSLEPQDADSTRKVEKEEHFYGLLQLDPFFHWDLKAEFEQRIHKLKANLLDGVTRFDMNRLDSIELFDDSYSFGTHLWDSLNSDLFNNVTTSLLETFFGSRFSVQNDKGHGEPPQVRDDEQNDQATQQVVDQEPLDHFPIPVQPSKETPAHGQDGLFSFWDRLATMLDQVSSCATSLVGSTSPPQSRTESTLTAFSSRVRIYFGLPGGKTKSNNWYDLLKFFPSKPKHNRNEFKGAVVGVFTLLAVSSLLLLHVLRCFYSKRSNSIGDQDIEDLDVGGQDFGDPESIQISDQEIEQMRRLHNALIMADEMGF